MILLALSLAFLVLGNGVLSLTNPDEVFYVQTAKEMIRRGEWMTPYIFGAPQFEKPVCLYWLLRIGFDVSGTSASLAATSLAPSASLTSFAHPATLVPPAASPSVAFAARLFPAMFAVVGVIATYFLVGLGFGTEKKAFVSAIVLMSAGLYIGLARTVYTDMIFSVFILLAMTSFFWGHTNAARRGVGSMLFFVFSALAVLTKGPLGLAIPFLAVTLFLAVRGELGLFFCRHSAWGFLVFLLIALPWYVFMIQRFGKAFTHEFFYNDHIRRLFEAEHPQNDRWYFYPGTAVIGMFPWSIFVLIAFARLIRRVAQGGARPVYLFLACWILVTFAVFQPAHSKLVSYIFPMFPALAVMTGDLVYDWIEAKGRRLAYGLAIVSSITFALAPLGLVAGHALYREYVPSSQSVNGLIALLGALLITMLLFAARKKYSQCVYLLSLQLPVLFFFGLLSHGEIDPRLSTKSACQWLLQHDASEDTVLCSKYFARGVHYFTDKNVAVIDIGGLGFFSPHPIPYLVKDEEVRGFLRRQPETHCIVDHSSLNHLRRIAGHEMAVDVLKKAGNEYVVRVTADPVLATPPAASSVRPWSGFRKPLPE